MIDTKLLRQKILDLAIRGKLVPQDPTDEPASELLKKIKAEKDALVKAGKIKKDKHESHIFKGDDNRYYEQIDGKTSDITDEIPFDLPDGWTWSRLKSTAIITTGATPATNVPDYYGGNIPFVKPPDLGESKYIGKTAENLTRHGAEKSRIVPPKSICVCCIGSLGKSSIATDYICTNQQINSITTSLNEQFVYYLCNSSYFIAALHSMATAITIALVNKSKMEQILIPFPPLAEQQRIVEQIETLLGYVDIIDTDAETLEKSITLAKQKILDLAIRGKLVPQDPSDEPASELLKKIKAEKDALVKAGKLKKDKHESYIFKSDDNCYYWHIGNNKTDTVVQEPFALPDSWSWTNLGFIADVARGGSPRPIEHYITETEDGINWIKIGDTVPGCKYITQTKEKIIPAGISKSRYVEPGDFLLSNSMSFGRPYILKISGCIHDGWLVIHPQAGAIYQDFLFYALSSPCIHALFVELASGSTVKNLKSDSVRLLKFPLPPYNEQKRIAESIEKYWTILESISK